MSMLASVLQTVFWGVLVLSVIVFVHEGGHYLVARAFKVRVTEFYLGLPCRIKLFHKSKRHGTEVGVTPLLLGGYNRICGMEGTEDELLGDAFAVVQREGRAPAQMVADELGVDIARAYDMLATLCDWAAIRPYFDPALGETPTQRDFPAAFETLQRDAAMLTEYDDGHDFSSQGTTGAGAPRPLAHPAEQHEMERSHTYLGCSYVKRLLMLLAGPAVNLILAFVLVTATFMCYEYTQVIDNNTVGAVTEGSLAEAAGIQAGYEILRVGDTHTQSWTDVSGALKEARAKGEDFQITLRREGQEQTVTIRLPEGEEVEYIGVSACTVTYRLTLPEAMGSALDYAATVASYALSLINPSRTMEVLETSSSIVGISVMVSQAASQGLIDLMAMVAAISMSLGFMNLLPIPPLDGGKILVETLQLALRRALPSRVVNILSYVGLAFFVFVFVYVVRNDVLRLIVG